MPEKCDNILCYARSDFLAHLHSFWGWWYFFPFIRLHCIINISYSLCLFLQFEWTLKWVLSKFEIFSILLLLPNLRNSMASCVEFYFCCFCRFSPYLSSSFPYWTLCFSVLIFLFWKVVFDRPLLLSDSMVFSPDMFSPSFVVIRSCTSVLSHSSRYTFIIWAAGWDTGKKVTGTLQGEAYKRNELCSFQLPVDRNYWSYASRQTQAHR